MIPKIIHFVWIGPPIPDWASTIIGRWRDLNPDYKIMLHSEESLLPSLRKSYDACKHWCSKSDLLRYSALRQHGGWYMDCDFWPFRPLDTIYSCINIPDGRMLISKQQGHKSGGKLPYGNTPIGCTADNVALGHIIAACTNTARASKRIGYGPVLIKKAVARKPELFSILEPNWFFPWSIAQAPGMIRCTVNTPDKIKWDTPSRVPIAAHLWANAVNIATAFGVPKPVAIVDSLHRGIIPLYKGLEAAGYRVVLTTNPCAADVQPNHKVALVISWNDVKAAAKGWVDLAVKHSALMLYAEHGWFNRGTCIQLGTKGIQHRAAWVHREGAFDIEPATDLVPTTPRNKGYILVLGQVDGDAQLSDSLDVPDTNSLLANLSKNAPSDIELLYRPHPAAKNTAKTMEMNPRVRLSDNLTSRKDYFATKHGASGLTSDLSGCRFAVAINSTALIEATMAGIPCLAFGPSIGIEAKAFHPASKATLAQDIGDMLEGWIPEPTAPGRLVAALRANQYSPSQLGNGDTIREIISHES